MQSLRRFCGRSCDCGTGAVWPRAKNARGVSCEGWWKRNGNACHGQKQAGGAAVEMWSLLMFAGPRSQNEWQACTDNGRCNKVPGRGRGRLGRPCFPNWSIIASRTWRSPSHATCPRGSTCPCSTRSSPRSAAVSCTSSIARRPIRRSTAQILSNEHVRIACPCYPRLPC